MKKKLLFIPVTLFALAISGCNTSAFPDNFTEADQVVETPWSDFVLPATDIIFEDGEEDITIVKGETHTYQYTIQPRGATLNSLSWSSNDEDVATVEEGTVTAVSGGKAVITASIPNSEFIPVELNVNVVVPLVDFNLVIPEDFKLGWDEQYQFEVNYDPVDTTEKDLIYEITDSTVPGLLSVSDIGLITTTKQNGSATLKVSSSNGNIVNEYTLTVNSTAVENVTITSTVHEVELNHTLELSATVNPNNAYDLEKSGVSYYSRNPDIASIDKVTGVVLGLKPGTAQIYAKCGDVESPDYEVQVYKVNVTNLDITTNDFTLTNATEEGLSKQLAYTLTLDRPNHEVPSDASIIFQSNDESVATVNDKGVVTAVGPGNATITMIVKQADLADLEDTVNVTVNIVSKTLTITGGNSFYNDSTLSLSAVLTPLNVSNNEITWSLEEGAGIVSLSATTGASVTLTPLNNEVSGSVKVKAVNTGGASNEITVTVNDRPAEFTVGHHYIVGSALYNTGESIRKDGKSSWTDAKYAYHFTYSVTDPSVYEQYKGTIKFQAGDQFKYFVGSDYWVPAWEQQDGWAERGYHIQQDGANNAFVKGQMRFVKENENHEFVASDAADANIEVVEAGYYDLYAKLYKNADESLWYSLYIEKVPTLNVEASEITMGVDEAYQIKAHDWIGDITYEIISGEEYISINSNGLVVGKGSAGVAVVRVNDDRDVPVDVTITLQNDAPHISKTVYLNANGLFDTDNVVPFVHSWGADNASPSEDVMMNKVEGQTIVYSATIPVDHTKIDFVRCPEGSTSIVWDNTYNQSKDQDIPTDGKDMFTMTGWTDEQDGSHRTYLDGEWSTFDSLTIYTVDSGSGENPPATNEMVIYFSNNKNWSDVHFYVFNSSTHAQASTWPGQEAEWAFKNEYNQDVYRLAINTELYDSFIFNGSGCQTVDILLSSLTGTNNAFYLEDSQDSSGHYYVGQWSYNP